MSQLEKTFIITESQLKRISNINDGTYQCVNNKSIMSSLSRIKSEDQIIQNILAIGKILEDVKEYPAK